MKISIYNLHFASLGGGERNTACLAAHLARRHKVTLFVWSPVDVAQVRALFGIDLSRVKIVPLAGKDQAEALRRAAPNIFINNTHASELPCPARRGIYMCMFPQAPRFDLSSYDVVAAVSDYVASWTERKWGRRSQVVYPACELIDRGDEPKLKLILNVGRFFEDAPLAHHKRQDILVQAFRQMVDAGAEGWELLLVGNVGGRAEDQLYVDQLRRRAEGYPIRIAIGLGFDELQCAYRRASIYWHGAGYGFDEQLLPSKQEHFGITIVEAMSAGAVPLAFNGGGPKQTITDGADGFLWNNPTQLIGQTRRLMQDPVLCAQMAARALAVSQQYSAAEFLARMDAIVEELAAS